MNYRVVRKNIDSRMLSSIAKCHKSNLAPTSICVGNVYIVCHITSSAVNDQLSWEGNLVSLDGRHTTHTYTLCLLKDILGLTRVFVLGWLKVLEAID